MSRHLLDNYTIDPRTRYEAHTLIYAREDGDPIRFGGILAAAVFSALIADTDEGDRRGIVLDTEAQRDAWYDVYEHETRRENGGLLTTEVQSLKEAYVELTSSDNALFHICQNARLYDLAVGLMDGYMQRLVREQVCEQIYEVHPWHEPFAQWLFDAGFIESWRQGLLAINWTNPSEVFTLAEDLSNAQRPTTNDQRPLFLFDGLSADQLLNGYWEWLWGEVQKQANLYPDANVRLAELKKTVLAQETDYDFLRPDLQSLAPDQLTLFRNWMARWKEFVGQKLASDIPTSGFKHPQQELFLDEIMSVPPAHNYVAVRTYILERCKYDKNFEKYFRLHKMTEMAQQLTLLFGWPVDDNALGKRMRSKAKK